MKLHSLSRLLVAIVLFAGCTSTKARVEMLPPPNPVEVSTPPENYTDLQDEIPQDADIITEELVEIPTGIIFAKTIFDGVLNAGYVRLQIRHLLDSQTAFQLHIGEEAGSSVIFPWDVRPVRPGYFFLELPPGEYQINAVSIPVGSTRAKEPLDVRFTVEPATATYLGTLHIVGTKEKIRLGGVPLIKPGFEYQLHVVDEREEAIKTFHARYPEYTETVEVGLMKALPRTIKE